MKKASRRVVALSLRELALIRLPSGDNGASVDILRRSIDFEDAPESHLDLASAYLSAGKTDQAMTEATNVVVTDPGNSLAWRIQGQIWLIKRNYERGAEALNRSSQLHADAYTQYLLGCALLELRQLEAARIAFRNAFAPERKNIAHLHALVSDAYLNANYLDDAARELTQSLALDPKLARAHYRAALLESARNNWAISAKVRGELAKEIQLDPRDFFGNYALGVSNFYDGRDRQTEAFLNVACRAKPDWPESWLYLGLTAYNSGDHKRAEEYLRKAISLTSDDSRGDYQIRRAYYTLGRILTQENRQNEATEFARRVREIQSKMLLHVQQTPTTMGGGMAQMNPSAAAFASLARVQTENSFLLPAMDAIPSHMDLAPSLAVKQHASMQKAETELRRTAAAALNDLGAVEARQGEFALALGHLHEAEKWDADTPGLMRNIGMASVRTSDYDEAVRALRPVLASAPRDTVARAMLGLALFTTNAYREAAEVFVPLGDSVLDNPELAYAFAASLVKTNQFLQATALLEKLSARPISAQTLILIAQTWSQMGNYPKTVETCHKASASDAKVLRAHYIAGLAMIHQDRPAEAAQEFRSELQLDPGNVDAQFHLAFALLQLSQNEEATRWLKDVLARNPEHPEANYELGKQLMSEGKSLDAIPYLEASARLRPEFEPVHYQLQAAYRASGRKQDADREAAIYRRMKAKSRNISLPPPRQEGGDFLTPKER